MQKKYVQKCPNVIKTHYYIFNLNYIDRFILFEYKMAVIDVVKYISLIYQIWSLYNLFDMCSPWKINP